MRPENVSLKYVSISISGAEFEWSVNINKTYNVATAPYMR